MNSQDYTCAFLTLLQTVAIGHHAGFALWSWKELGVQSDCIKLFHFTFGTEFHIQGGNVNAQLDEYTGGFGFLWNLLTIILTYHTSHMVHGSVQSTIDISLCIVFCCR